MNGTVKIGVIIAIALVIAWAVGERSSRAPATARDVMSTVEVDDIKLSADQIRTLLGKKVRAADIGIKTPSGVKKLSDFKGQVVLIDFWGTWCGPCRMAIPGIQRAYIARKDQGFAVMGVAIENDGGGQVPAFVEELGMTYDVGMAVSKEELENYPFESLPTTVLVDRTGQIRWANEGYSPKIESQMIQLVDALLAEKS